MEKLRSVSEAVTVISERNIGEMFVNVISIFQIWLLIPATIPGV